MDKFMEVCDKKIWLILVKNNYMYKYYYYSNG